jgi:hypothetical protein
MREFRLPDRSLSSGNFLGWLLWPHTLLIHLSKHPRTKFRCTSMFKEAVSDQALYRPVTALGFDFVAHLRLKG